MLLKHIEDQRRNVGIGTVIEGQCDSTHVLVLFSPNSLQPRRILDVNLRSRIVWVDLFGSLLGGQLQAIQLAPKNTKLRAQVSNESLIAKGEVRLSRAYDHAFHFVHEALDNGAAVFLTLD